MFCDKIMQILISQHFNNKYYLNKFREYDIRYIFLIRQGIMGVKLQKLLNLQTLVIILSTLRYQAKA